MKARTFLWGMVLVLLVATALRFAAFGRVPPGLYHDEAYNGLDALSVLQGKLALYFPANNGREPLFIYLVAASLGTFGRSPFAMRLPAFFAGVLTVAATAAMGRAAFTRRTGLLAAAVLAVTLWHVHLSRVGFRAGLLPLFIALTAWQGAWAVRTQRWPHWLAAGVLYGFSFNTYTAARLTPMALAVFGLFALVAHRSVRDLWSPAGRRLWQGIGLAALAALLTVAPLAAYALAHPEIVLGRPEQVSILSPSINGGDLWGTLARHTLRTLGMFFVRGDRIWRHNVPWRPVFDPVLGALFVLGVVLLARRARRQPGAGFVLIWLAVMAAPTLLAEDAPHFLRAVGLLPVVALPPAVGLSWLADRTRSLLLRRNSSANSGHAQERVNAISSAMLVFPLVFGLGSTAWAYFHDYARDPTAGYWFEEGAVSLAGEINAFLGTGWDGGTKVHEGLDDRHAYLDETLWQEWPQVRVLIAAPEELTIGLAGQPSPGSTAVFLWPYADWRRAWALLPAPSEVAVETGPLSQGDRDLQPYITYLAFFATPLVPKSPNLGRFADGVELLDVTVTPTGADGVQVRLRWRVTAPLSNDYTVFLHYLRDGKRIAQADARPAAGYFPTTAWRAGDVVIDEHRIEGTGAPILGRDILRVGLWLPGTSEVLHLLDGAGNPAGDWLDVAVEPGP